MVKVILITATFPYLPGEQFLETEVKYFSQSKGIDLTIMPVSDHASIRKVDKNIHIDTYLVGNINKSIVPRLFYLLKSAGSSLFYRELFASKFLLNVVKLKNVFAALSRYQNYYEAFDKYFKNKDSSENLIIYTYWNSEATYALQSLKKKYGYKLVSRIHGHDIYMKARPHEYMPLKSFFVYDIDKIYTITESAAGYLRENYGFNLNTIELSRLGVDDHSVISLPNSDNVFQIVSCSFLVEIKQVHKIISALEVVCGAQKDIDFIWNHIGGGKLYEVLLALARKKLSNIKNLKFNFLGVINNSDVYEFYKNNKVDVFINVSKSEGVPVSIMEAMSCHIPIIAPNVGGVSDMVKHEHNGLLLTKSCEVSEIINALSEIGFFKNRHVRENAYKVFRENFNAKSNYSGFIKNLMKLRAGALAPQRSKSPC